ncbi:uncharacterized protein LOC107041359 [Diachasma alloeum]|uniref:uncharacterized protein LOC107041359 n=1 Tax=Diachasma alloeum TaxID=454923 RepID=UPI0007383BEF|nr:uncharacterized protein LOC107041359 [Diachasma alloeum]
MENIIIPDSDESDQEFVSPELFSDMDKESSTSSMSVNVNSLNDSSVDKCTIPQDVLDQVRKAESILIPQGSKPIYDRAYHKFQAFVKEKRIKTVNETVLLGYFNLLRRPNEIDPCQKDKPGIAPSSLWAIYSMLKSTLLAYDKIYISDFHTLLSFLSANTKQSDHIKKKAKIFTEEELARFLETAPDKDWLAVKVACILGIHGFCRQLELYKLTPQHIEDHQTCLNVKLVKTKNGSTRPFSFTGPFWEILKKYIA